MGGLWEGYGRVFLQLGFYSARMSHIDWGAAWRRSKAAMVSYMQEMYTQASMAKNTQRISLWMLVLLAGLVLLLGLQSTMRAPPIAIIQPKPKPVCDCSGHGRCFLGKCFCDRGFTGDACGSHHALEPPLQESEGMECMTDDDMCRFTSENGVTVVSRGRWRRAQEGEMTHWATSSTNTNDGWEHHGKDFGFYKTLDGLSLGHYIEIGCGPFTQTIFMRSNVPSAQFASITLVDPLLYSYLQRVEHCTYKGGHLGDFNQSLVLISSPTEALRFEEDYDSLMTMNVLEHVQDAFAHLELIYNSLRPKGLLIFHERWWNKYVPTQEKNDNYKQWLMHPIRVRQPVIDHFLSKFTPLYRLTSSPPKEPGVYFIGIKA